MSRARPTIAARWRRLARRLHADRRAAMATEYILILTLVVLPIALLMPMFLSMIRIYAGRMSHLIGLPFP
jgi:hypothetical protein